MGTKINLSNLGTLKDFLCRSFKTELAFSQDDPPVRDLEGGLGILFHHQNGYTCLGNFYNAIKEFVHDDW